jgi:hypothetical protein
MVTPQGRNGMHFAAFWVRVRKGTTYRLSIWAKADRPGTRFEIAFPDLTLAARSFDLTTGWAEYALEVAAPRDIDRAGGPELSYQGPGTAWFDLLQFAPIGASRSRPAASGPAPANAPGG